MSDNKSKPQSGSPLLQPIVSLEDHRVIGLEAGVASAKGLERLPWDLDFLAMVSVLGAYNRVPEKTNLFVSIALKSLFNSDGTPGKWLDRIVQWEIPLDRVVLVMAYDEKALPELSRIYRSFVPLRKQGLRLCVDEFGGGDHDIRLLSELQPEYARIDVSLVREIDVDTRKRKVVQGLTKLAHSMDIELIAGFIEQGIELQVLNKAGIKLVQGDFVAEPSALPQMSEFNQLPRPKLVVEEEETSSGSSEEQTLKDLLEEVEPFSPNMTVKEFSDYLSDEGKQQSAFPLVEADGTPAGLVARGELLEKLCAPFGRQFIDPKPIKGFGDPNWISVDHEEPLEKVSKIITGVEYTRYPLDHFILTKDGLYIGVGSVRKLLKAMTDRPTLKGPRLHPVSGLPLGSDQVGTHLRSLLDSLTPFCIAYVSLDNLKAYRDHYGDAEASQLIKGLANILLRSTNIDPSSLWLGRWESLAAQAADDEFVLVLPGLEHQQDFQSILDSFAEFAPTLYEEKDREANGIWGTDIEGNTVFYPIASLSMGVMCIAAGRFSEPSQIVEVGLALRAEAKRKAGNTMVAEGDVN